MAARVPDGQPVGNVDLLAGLHTEHCSAAAVDGAATGVEVDREFGVTDVALARSAREPLDLVGEGLFVAGHHANYVAVGHELVALPPNHVRDDRRNAFLVVDRSAAVPPAVLFRHYERIRRPVLPQRGNDVEVSHQQDRAASAASAQAHDDIADAVRIPGDERILLAESRRAQTANDRVRRFHRSARAGNRSYPDQLAEYGACEGRVRGWYAGLCSGTPGCDRRQSGDRDETDYSDQVAFFAR